MSQIRAPGVTRVATVTTKIRCEAEAIGRTMEVGDDEVSDFIR